jgi:threonine dehydrogenase-like Zn-dependent dehydrogenase
MRALLYTDSHDLVVCEVDPPRATDDEVVVRVEAAGICASDVDGIRSRSDRRAPPLIMGHELTGEIVAAGGVRGRDLIGARVVVNPQVTCGDCRWCRSGRENLCGRRDLIGGSRPGGFAELVAVPVRCIHRVSSLAAPETTVLTEPLATCLHAFALAPDRYAETAVVLGGGTIGTLAAQLLRRSGAQHVIISEPLVERHEGLCAVADGVVAPEDLLEAVAVQTGGIGVELAVDAVGTRDSRRDSLRVLCAGGCAVWMGMHASDGTIPAFDVVVREQRVVGSFAYTNVEFGRALGLLERRLLQPAVPTRSVPLAESGATLQRLVDGAADGVVKAIVRPSLVAG